MVQHRLIGYVMSTQKQARHSTFLEIDADIVQEGLDRLL